MMVPKRVASIVVVGDMALVTDHKGLSSPKSSALQMWPTPFLASIRIKVR